MGWLLIDVADCKQGSRGGGGGNPLRGSFLGGDCFDWRCVCGRRRIALLHLKLECGKQRVCPMQTQTAALFLFLGCIEQVVAGVFFRAFLFEWSEAN